MRVRFAALLAAGAMVLGPAAVAIAPVADATPASKVAGTRKVGAKIVKKHNKLFFQGKVQDYKKKKLVIQKATCDPSKPKCKFKKFKKVKTDAKNKYRQQVPAPRKGKWYWRAMVPASGGYDVSYSSIWYTYTL
ncbi:MAG: hypothetical protein QM714_15505 [Nocardioides sp.]|uniref:hypothetical protein n=1 Tax=Nocardioides sp. TaxID=35761 RepID=UPI0039E63990